MQPEGTDALATVREALESSNLRFTQTTESKIELMMTSERSNCVTIEDHPEKGILCFTFSPLTKSFKGQTRVASREIEVVRIPGGSSSTQERLARACAFLLDANDRMLMGSLYRRSGNGEIGLVISVPYQQRGLCKEQVDLCLFGGLFSMDRLMPQLEEVLGIAAEGTRPIRLVV